MLRLGPSRRLTTESAEARDTKALDNGDCPLRLHLHIPVRRSERHAPMHARSIVAGSAGRSVALRRVGAYIETLA